jgi:hypothetical protein
MSCRCAICLDKEKAAKNRSQTYNSGGQPNWDQLNAISGGRANPDRWRQVYMGIGTRVPTPNMSVRFW